jgi:hypothetical protein
MPETYGDFSHWRRVDCLRQKGVKIIILLCDRASLGVYGRTSLPEVVEEVFLFENTCLAKNEVYFPYSLNLNW